MRGPSAETPGCGGNFPVWRSEPLTDGAGRQAGISRARDRRPSVDPGRVLRSVSPTRVRPPAAGRICRFLSGPIYQEAFALLWNGGGDNPGYWHCARPVFEHRSIGVQSRSRQPTRVAAVVTARGTGAATV